MAGQDIWDIREPTTQAPVKGIINAAAVCGFAGRQQTALEKHVAENDSAEHHHVGNCFTGPVFPIAFGDT